MQKRFSQEASGSHLLPGPWALPVSCGRLGPCPSSGAKVLPKAAEGQCQPLPGTSSLSWLLADSVCLGFTPLQKCVDYSEFGSLGALVFMEAQKGWGGKGP